MEQKERTRLINKFGIKDFTRGNYAEGLFDGLKCAEKYYNKRIEK